MLKYKHAVTQKTTISFGVRDYGFVHMVRNLVLEQNKTEQEIVNLAFEMAKIDRHSDFNRSVLAAASIR